MVRQIGLWGILGAVACAAALGGCTTISDVDVDKNQVSVAEVRRLMDVQKRKNRDDVILLVDPRPPSEFEKAHIPGARNILLTHVKPKDPIDPSIDRFKNIIVYGNDPGSASARAMTKRLMSNGYSHVAFFASGLYQWLATGGELAGAETKQAQATPVGDNKSTQ
jgi:rhodanese-related sulfurtransferase